MDTQTEPRFVVDSSAIVAVFLKEAESEIFQQHLAQATEVRISVASAIETGIVLGRRFGKDMTTVLEAFFRRLVVQLVPLDAHHFQEALNAWWRFGKGRSPARLNLGDCYAYATARLANLPLLCKGDDFKSTDLPCVNL